MTSIVGILCHDGVVIGADSSVTFTHGNFPTIEQSSEKIKIIDKSIIIAGTGAVGLKQRFCSIVEEGWKQNLFTGSEINLSTLIARETIKNFGQTAISPPKIPFGALMAYPVDKTHYLCEFGVGDFQPEHKTENLWYVSMGSAQPITDTFLGFIRDIYWGDGLPSIQDATFAVVWTLGHAINVNPGGVNGPMQVAILEKNRKKHLEARILGGEELGEHKQAVEDAKDTLRKYKSNHQADDIQVEIPKAPDN